VDEFIALQKDIITWKEFLECMVFPQQDPESNGGSFEREIDSCCLGYITTTKVPTFGEQTTAPSKNDVEHLEDAKETTIV